MRSLVKRFLLDNVEFVAPAVAFFVTGWLVGWWVGPKWGGATLLLAAAAAYAAFLSVRDRWG